MDNALHVSQYLLRNKHCGIREKLLPSSAGEDFVGVVTQLIGNIVSDCWPVKCDANAVLVQPFRVRLI